MHNHHGVTYAALFTNATTIVGWHLQWADLAVIVSSAATVAGVMLQFYLAFRGRRDKRNDKG